LRVRAGPASAIAAAGRRPHNTGATRRTMANQSTADARPNACWRAAISAASIALGPVPLVDAVLSWVVRESALPRPLPRD
jgi:hypothetical protein